MNSEHIIVELVEPKGKVFVELLNKNRVNLVAADLKGVTLKLEVNGGVVVPDIRHVLYAGDLLGDHVGVLHSHQGHRDPHKLVDVIGPGPWKQSADETTCV